MKLFIPNALIPIKTNPTEFVKHELPPLSMVAQIGKSGCNYFINREVFREALQTTGYR